MLGAMEKVILDSSDIHGKCRLCLTECKTMRDLLASDGSHLNQVLLEKISDSLSIMITEFDNLPTKVCWSCCMQVEKVYDFKKKCLAVDTLLRNHVKHKHKEKGQSTILLHNVASGSDNFSKHKSSEVSKEYGSVPSTSSDKVVYDPEILKVEIKEEREEEEDEISDESICSVSGVVGTSKSYKQSCKQKQGELKQGISSKRKVKVTPLLENPKFKCPSCGKSFCNKYSLSRHRWSHSKRTFSCTVCDKVFTNHESWLRHEKMHESGNRYKCEMCEKSYMSSTSYAAHLRKHTGERPYKCSDCEETFYLLSSFERHSAKHRGMKEFRCEICSAAFWVPDDLRAHVNRMH